MIRSIRKLVILGAAIGMAGSALTTSAGAAGSVSITLRARVEPACMFRTADNQAYGGFISMRDREAGEQMARRLQLTMICNTENGIEVAVGSKNNMQLVKTGDAGEDAKAIPYHYSIPDLNVRNRRSGLKQRRMSAKPQGVLQGEDLDITLGAEGVRMASGGYQDELTISFIAN